MVSGNGDYPQNLQARLYLNNKSDFTLATLPKITENASVIKTIDFDNDGDLDVFIGNNSKNNRFGSSPSCYLLQNNNGNFTTVQNKTFDNIGMVTNATISDFNNDGKPDIIVVGECMQPTFFKT